MGCTGEAAAASFTIDLAPGDWLGQSTTLVLPESLRTRHLVSALPLFLLA